MTKILTKKKQKFNPLAKVKEQALLMDKLTEELKEQGATIFLPKEMEGTLNIDTDYLSLPSDLTEVSPRDLGKFLNAFTQNKAYMRTLYNWQEQLLEQFKRLYYDCYIIVYKRLTTENPKMSEKAKELMCNNDDLVKDDFLKYKDQQLKLSMLSNTIASYEEIIFLISREISRRGLDFSEQKRYDNLR